MFDNDYGPSSAPVFAVASNCGVPCMLLDYAGMHVMRLHLGSPTRLLNGFYQLFESALENGEIQNRYSLVHPAMRPTSHDEKYGKKGVSTHY